MRALSGADILRVWDLGEGQAPVRQALTLLGCACPHDSRAQLSELRIGQRDALLFSLREQLFGHTLRSYAECPCCLTQVVFTLTTTDLRRVAPPDFGNELRCGDYHLQFRFPSSRDLEQATKSGQPERSIRALFESCIVSARRDDGSGEQVAPTELPGSVVSALASELERGDPQANINLALSCAACQHGWVVAFDIASFLWKELEAAARRLLQEVDALARVYGWSETKILRLSPKRRQRYLELAAS